MKDIQNKVAVVTGGSEGIGKGIAKALVKHGAKVILVSRSQDKLDAAVAELGGDTHAVSADLSNPASVKQAMESVEQQWGRVDILVNNVGGGTFKPLDMQSTDEALLPVALPLQAAVAATHAVVPGMMKRKQGHLVNLTSPAGYIPFANMMPYVAARHAMVGLSFSMHEELKAFNVGSTLFCPAQVNTGYFQHNDADIDWYPKGSKLFPVLEPEVVGEQVVKAIKRNKREAIYPWLLWSYIRSYQKMPGLTVLSMKLLGLWKPAAKR